MVKNAMNEYKYDTFEDWFNEVEVFALRSERFFMEQKYLPPEKMREWLRAAFEDGRELK